MFGKEIRARARCLLKACRSKGLHVATAESCTGGLISAALTEIAGSSDVFERGFVTYQNEAKAEDLGVSEESLAAHGAVSEPVVREMALGALRRVRVGDQHCRDGYCGARRWLAGKTRGTGASGICLHGWKYRSSALRIR